MSTLYYETQRGSTLCHHGIKGQKWGVQNGPPYPLQEYKNNATMNMNYDRFSTIRLSKKECGHVMHELQTNISRIQRANDIIHKCIGDYSYTAINNHDGTFRIVSRRRIK